MTGVPEKTVAPGISTPTSASISGAEALGSPLSATLIAIGRFHHFHLARQLERRGLLDDIWSGYPAVKLKDETGIAPEKIHPYPWFHVPALLVPRLPLIGRSIWLTREFRWAAFEAIDKRVERTLKRPGVLVSMSSGGLHSGTRMRRLGGYYICDRASSHIRYQDEILREEYRRWNTEFEGVDPRVVQKEEAEYQAADVVALPSDFCYRSFVAKGVAPEKLRVIPYGGRLDRFSPVAQPEPESFTVLFVGGVSIRKGVPYLLEAFKALKHPNKKLKIIGAVQDEMREILRSQPLENVSFLGIVPNADLAKHYSTADVMVLPSLEEGLAYVMAEAMACGCPVIASVNTGAENLFTHEQEGFIVPIRSTSALIEGMEAIAQDQARTAQMRKQARRRIESLGGYDRYGTQFADLLNQLPERRREADARAA